MLKNVKIALVKGEKGNTGYPTTKEIQDAIAGNPSILVDEATVNNAVAGWLETHQDELLYSKIYTAEKTVNDVAYGTGRLFNFFPADFGLTGGDSLDDYIVVGAEQKAFNTSKEGNYNSIHLTVTGSNDRVVPNVYHGSRSDGSKMIIAQVINDEEPTTSNITLRIAITKVR